MKNSIIALIFVTSFSCKSGSQTDTDSSVLESRASNFGLIHVCRSTDEKKPLDVRSLGGRAAEFALDLDSDDGQKTPCYQSLNYKSRYAKECFANSQGQQTTRVETVNDKVSSILLSLHVSGTTWERYLLNVPNNWNSLPTFDGFIKDFVAAPVSLTKDLSNDNKAVALRCKNEPRREKE